MRAGRSPGILEGAVMNKLLNIVSAAILASLAFAVPASAQSQYDGLTAAVDWSDAITALVAVAALVAGMLVVRKGVKFVLGMIR